ncbi:MAG: MFS transporter [Candidatus Symbiodolus clandestinus]
MDNSPSGDYRITGLLGHTGPEKKYLLAQLCVCVALCFGSFIDEAAQVTFSLHLADDASSVSALLSAGVFGALLAGPLSPRILYRIGPLKSISLAFIVQSLLITGASLVNQFIAYLIVAVALGCTGSIFWSAIMVAVPSFAQQDCEINRINRVMQAVRNCGHVGGPALGGVLYALAEGSQGMLLLALLALFAALITLVCFKILHPHSYHTVVSDPDNSRKGLDLIGLLRTNEVIHAFSPLIITIILTSMLNVLLIIRVRNDLKLSAEIYGLIVSMLSVGLVLGPLTLSGLFNRFSDAASASMAAAIWWAYRYDADRLILHRSVFAQQGWNDSGDIEGVICDLQDRLWTPSSILPIAERCGLTTHRVFKSEVPDGAAVGMGTAILTLKPT